LLVAATAVGGAAACTVVAAGALGEATNAVQVAHGDSSQPAPPAIPAAESGTVVSGQPFADPPIISSPASSLDVTLTANATPVVISGKKVNARVYSAASGGVEYPPAYMPPVISVRQNQRLVVNLKNNLPETTNLHTHGFFISPKGKVKLFSADGKLAGVFQDEEAAVLKVPSVQMRTSTERPQVYDTGGSIKFDPHQSYSTSDLKQIVDSARTRNLTMDPHSLGDGRASERISADLIQRLKSGDWGGHEPDAARRPISRNYGFGTDSRGRA
jgi:hypothetical protein